MVKKSLPFHHLHRVPKNFSHITGSNSVKCQPVFKVLSLLERVWNFIHKNTHETFPTTPYVCCCSTLESQKSKFVKGYIGKYIAVYMTSSLYFFSIILFCTLRFCHFFDYDIFLDLYFSLSFDHLIVITITNKKIQSVSCCFGKRSRYNV